MVTLSHTVVSIHKISAYMVSSVGLTFLVQVGVSLLLCKQHLANLNKRR